MKEFYFSIHKVHTFLHILHTKQHFVSGKMGYTYKFLWTRKVEQLYHSKVIACDDVEAGVRHTSTGYICLICVPGPDPHHLIPEDTTETPKHVNTAVLQQPLRTITLLTQLDFIFILVRNRQLLPRSSIIKVHQAAKQEI